MEFSEHALQEPISGRLPAAVLLLHENGDGGGAGTLIASYVDG